MGLICLLFCQKDIDNIIMVWYILITIKKGENKMKRIYEKGLLPNGDRYIIYKVYDHYELYINGEFWCSGENYREIDDELNEMLGK